MLKINIYLNFLGKAEEAFNFYKSVFGGEFTMIQRYKDMSMKDMPEMGKLDAKDKEKIMHISLPVGGNVLMGGDSLEYMGNKLTVGDNFNVSLSCDSEKEADEIFEKLSAGGKAEMPMGKTFWGSYFGMLVDKFGIWWMVSYDYDKDGK